MFKKTSLVESRRRYLEETVSTITISLYLLLTAVKTQYFSSSSSSSSTSLPHSCFSTRSLWLMQNEIENLGLFRDGFMNLDVLYGRKQLECRNEIAMEFKAAIFCFFQESISVECPKVAKSYL